MKNGFLKHIETTVDSLEQAKTEKELTKQELDKEINLLNGQIEILKNSVKILFPNIKDSKGLISSRQALKEARNQRIISVIDFMRSQGSKNVHAKDIAEYLNLSRIGTRNWMNRIAQKADSPWRHSID